MGSVFRFAFLGGGEGGEGGGGWGGGVEQVKKAEAPREKGGESVLVALKEHNKK